MQMICKFLFKSIDRFHLTIRTRTTFRRFSISLLNFLTDYGAKESLRYHSTSNVTFNSWNLSDSSDWIGRYRIDQESQPIPKNVSETFNRWETIEIEQSYNEYLYALLIKSFQPVSWKLLEVKLFLSVSLETLCRFSYQKLTPKYTGIEMEPELGAFKCFLPDITTMNYVKYNPIYYSSIVIKKSNPKVLMKS